MAEVLGRQGPRRWVGLAVLVTLFSLVACTSGDDGEEPGPPPITRPLDASAYADRVCDLLPAEMAAQLGYPSPGTEFEHDDPRNRSRDYVTCSRYPWGDPSLNIDLYLSLDLLADEYDTLKDARILDSGKPSIELITIAEQPAAVINRNKKPNRTCIVVVGLTDRQGLRVSGSEHYRKASDGSRIGSDGRACDHVIAVAEVIIEHLSGDR